MVCRSRPKPCASDGDCSPYEYCDSAIGSCKRRNRYLYEGGPGCRMEAGAAIDRAGWLATAIAVLIAGLLGQRRRAQPA